MGNDLEPAVQPEGVEVLRFEYPNHGFDYSKLDNETAETVRSSAAWIKEKVLYSFIEVGDELQKIKEILGHGKFGPWLSAEFGWTPRTAQNYMAVAVWAREEGKSEIVSLLPPSSAYLLVAPSTPKEARDTVIKTILDGKEVTAKQVKEIVAEAKGKAKPKAAPLTKASAKVAAKASSPSPKPTITSVQSSIEQLTKADQQALADWLAKRGFVGKNA